MESGISNFDVNEDVNSQVQFHRNSLRCSSLSLVVAASMRMRSIVTYLPRKPLIDIILFFKGLTRKILAMLQFTKYYNIL